MKNCNSVYAKCHLDYMKSKGFTSKEALVCIKNAQKDMVKVLSNRASIRASKRSARRTPKRSARRVCRPPGRRSSKSM